MPDHRDIRAYSVEDFCDVFGIGKTLAYELIRNGSLQSVRVGKRRLIPAAAAEKWLASLPSIEPTAAA